MINGNYSLSLQLAQVLMNTEWLFKNSPKTKAYDELKKSYKEKLFNEIKELQKAKLDKTDTTVKFSEQDLNRVSQSVISLINEMNEIHERRENVIIHMEQLKKNLNKIIKLLSGL